MLGPLKRNRKKSRKRRTLKGETSLHANSLYRVHRIICVYIYIRQLSDNHKKGGKRSGERGDYATMHRACDRKAGVGRVTGASAPGLLLKIALTFYGNGISSVQSSWQHSAIALTVSSSFAWQCVFFLSSFFLQDHQPHSTRIRGRRF